MKNNAAFFLLFFCGIGFVLAVTQAYAQKPAKVMHPEVHAAAKNSENMQRIPGGEFTMGSETSHSMPNERPAHRVQVASFFIDETDVTNAAFQKFVDATGYVTTAEKPVNWEEMAKQLPPDTEKPSEEQLLPGALVFTPPDHAVDLTDITGWWSWTPGANWRNPQGPGSGIDGMQNHPVVQISWDDAVAYSVWAGKRLPTEAEWEFAALGGQDSKTRYYWGNEFKIGGKFMANTFTGTFPYKNTAEDGFLRTSPVKNYVPNGYGLYDMAGNVWNWCSDFYSRESDPSEQATIAKASSVSCDPKGPAAEGPKGPRLVEHVIKGGSFLCNPSYCESYRPSARRGTPYDTGSEHVGFRCALDDASAKPGLSK